MKVEVLYVAECPAHAPALALLERILAEEGVAAGIHQVLVQDENMARALRFGGSPTIRIDGRDVEREPVAAAYGVCCRLYPASPETGLPPAALVRQAVREARRQGSNGGGTGGAATRETR